jgi:hypothetical protein
MRIRMRLTEMVAMEGVDFGRLRAGSVHDLPAPVAAVLVSQGTAIALLQDEGREDSDTILSPGEYSPVGA